MSYWWAGAILAAVGSIASNLGVNVQKFSFLKNAKLEPAEQKPYVKQPLWAVGLVLVISGSLCDFAALALAAASIVSPIGALTLVSNIAFAHFGLKEILSKRDLFGTCLILLGSVLSVAFGNHTEQTYTMDELRELYTATGFIVYACVVSTAVLVLYVIAKRLQPCKEEMVEKCQAYERALLAEPRDPQLIQELDERIAFLESKYEKWAKIHPFSYCALSGCIGAQSIMFGKMLAEMIGMSFRGDNQMIYPLTYVFLACMLFCIFCQLHFLALGLRFFDALYVVPVFQCFFILGSTLGGAAYFAEFSSFGVTQFVLFPIGILLTLCGVYILSSRGMKQNINREDPQALLTSGQTGVEMINSDGAEIDTENPARDEMICEEGDLDDGLETVAATGTTEAKVHRLCVPGTDGVGAKSMAESATSAFATASGTIDYERVVDGSVQLVDRSARSGMAAPLAPCDADVCDDAEAPADPEDVPSIEGMGGKYFVPRPPSSSMGGRPASTLASLSRQPSTAGAPTAAAEQPAGNKTPRGGPEPTPIPVSVPLDSITADGRPPTFPRQGSVPSRRDSLARQSSVATAPEPITNARSQFARRLTASGAANPMALYNEGLAAGYGGSPAPQPHGSPRTAAAVYGRQSLPGNQTPRMGHATATASPISPRRATVADGSGIPNSRRSTWRARDEEGRPLRGSMVEAGFAVFGVPTGIDGKL